MSKNIDLRRFNSKGKDAFVTVIRGKAPNILDLVDDILNDATMTEVVLTCYGEPLQIEIKFFKRRFESG